MQKFKILLVYIFLFVLFYMEPEQIGPITFSQLWKIPLFMYLFWQVIILGVRSKPVFIKWSYARAVKTLFNKGFIINIMAELIDFIRYMMFPLMYEFASKKIKSIDQLNKLILGFAQFVIISGIPFIFGFLESKGTVLFELDDFQSYTGIFQNPHSASITTTTAVIIIIALFKSKTTIMRYPKLNLLIALLGIYLIFLTYVRTGYLMFAIGLIIIFKPQKFSLKQFMLVVIAVSVLVIGFVYLLETNENFYNRIFDIRSGRQTAAGSGRLNIYQAAIDLWLNGNFLELVFGFGSDGLREGINKSVGMKIYAHNEFLNQLGQNGLLGMLIFLGYLRALFYFIRKRRKSSSYRLAFTIYCLYVSLMLTQGGIWFPLDIFMVLVYVKLEFEYISDNKTKIQTQYKHQLTI